MSETDYLAGCLFCDKTHLGNVEKTVAWYMAHMINHHWDMVELLHENPDAVETRLRELGL